jgi:type III pantothenate kinase
MPEAAPLLTIDRGNTSFGVMLHTVAPRWWTAPVAESARVTAILANLPVRPSRVVASTVVAGGLDGVAAALTSTGLRLEVAGRDLPCPLALAYPDPTTLGTDRWLVALGAHAGWGCAVTVDCGTALKVDAVDATGRFLGGSIAPGLRAMARGLAAAAPRLPAFSAPDAVSVPAVSSQACVDVGVVLAFCGAVERLVDDVLTVVGPSAALLITGGDAATYLRHGRRSLRSVPDLLHRGLRCLAQTCGRPS